MARPKDISQWKESRNSSSTLVPINSEAQEEVNGKSNSPKSTSASVQRVSITESKETATLGPGWVKVPVSTPPQLSQTDSYRALGLSEAEAALAANGDHEAVASEGQQELLELLGR